MLKAKSYYLKKEDKHKGWILFDAGDKILGRLASEIAVILRGKHKPNFTPSVDMGDFVVVINAGKIKLTGDKLKKKIYYKHSGYPGGLKSRTAGDFLEKNPEQMLRLAVERMLPDNRMRSVLMRSLKIFRDATHTHEAQNPQLIV